MPQVKRDDSAIEFQKVRDEVTYLVRSLDGLSSGILGLESTVVSLREAVDTLTNELEEHRKVKEGKDK